MRRPRIRKNFSVLPLNPDEVMILLSPWDGIYVIKDPDKRGIASSVVKMLDGKHSLEEILEKFKDYKGEILQIINNLEKRGIVEDAAEEEVMSFTDSEKHLYYALSTFSPVPLYPKNSLSISAEKVVSTLRNSKVLVIGARMIGSRLVQDLASLNLGKIFIADDKKITDEDKYYIPHVNGSEGVTRAELVAEMIKSVYPNVNVEVVEEAKIKDYIPSTNIAILAKDRPSFSLAREINKACVENNVKWTQVTIDGTYGIIGPTVIPRETACYDCFMLRLESNVEAYARFIQYRQYLESQPYLELETIGLPSFASLLSGILVSDIPWILVGWGRTTGRYIYIDFTTFKITSEYVLKLPRCPTCGRKGPHYQPYRTFRQVIEELDKGGQQ